MLQSAIYKSLELSHQVVAPPLRALARSLNLASTEVVVDVDSRPHHPTALSFAPNVFNIRRITGVEKIAFIIIALLAFSSFWIPHVIIAAYNLLDLIMRLIFHSIMYTFPEHCPLPDDASQYEYQAYQLCLARREYTEMSYDLDSFNPPDYLYELTESYIPHVVVLIGAYIVARLLLKPNDVSCPHFLPPFLRPQFQDVAFLTSSFRRMAITNPPTIRSHHGHPVAAAARNTADSNINSFIVDSGFMPYSVQCSRRDLDNGVPGCFKRFWPSDFRLPERSDPLPARPFLKFINVDYYIDWYDYLYHGHPMVMYTFDPLTPCGTLPNDEGTWHFNADNTVTLSVRGVKEYRHPLWNYDVDSIHAVYEDAFVVYGCEKIRIDDAWSIVCLFPKTIEPRPWAAPTGLSLRRRQLTLTGINVLGSQITVGYTQFLRDGPRVSLGLLAPGKSTTIPHDVIHDVQTRWSIAQLKGKNLYPADLSALVRAHIHDDVEAITATTRFLELIIPGTLRSTFSHSVTQRAENPHYQRVPSPSDVDGKEPGQPARVLCPSLVGPAFVPSRTPANERWSVEERVTRLHNPMTALPPKYERYAMEFIALFARPVEPLLPSEVEELQSKPAQRAKNARAMPRLADWLATKKTVVKSFLKMEAYDSYKDPRNISTLPPEHCLAYSCFTIPAAKMVSKQPWYAFSKDPKQVEQRVHELAAAHRTVVETDFSRFDGTHSLALYNFELRFLKHCFRPIYHRELEKLHRQQYHPSAFTKSGFAYDPAGSRLSGSADTSFGNSLDSALIAYCAYRESGFSPEAAAARLGLYGGDDGITYDIDPVIYQRVARELGLKLKAVPKSAAAPTGMLGRIHLAPATIPGSIADPVRALRKLHITVDETNTPEQCLVNKAQGFITTDARTPLLGAWARKVLQLHPHLTANALSYTASLGSSELPDDLVSLAYDYVASQLQVDRGLVESVEREILEAKSVQDFPADPFPFEEPQLPPGTSNASEEATIPAPSTDPREPPCPVSNAQEPPPPNPAPRADNARPRRTDRRRGTTASTRTDPPTHGSPASPASTSKRPPTKKDNSSTSGASTASNPSAPAGGPASPASTTSTASTVPASASTQLSAPSRKGTSPCASTATPSSTVAAPSRTSPPATKQSPAASPAQASSPSTATSSTVSVGTSPAQTLPSPAQPAPASSTSKLVAVTPALPALATAPSAKSRSNSTSRSPSPPPSPRTPQPSPSRTKPGARSPRSAPKTSRARSNWVPRKNNSKESPSPSPASKPPPSSSSPHPSPTTPRSQSTQPRLTSSTSGLAQQSLPSSAASTATSSPTPAQSRPGPSNHSGTSSTKVWRPRPMPCADHGVIDCIPCHTL